MKLKRFCLPILTTLLLITAIVSVGANFFWRYPLELLTNFRVYYFLLSFLIAIAFLGGELIKLRSRVFLFISLALFTFNSIWIVPWYLPNSHQGKGELLRVLTFNINTENQQFGAIADAIKKQKPDVATIVETTLLAKEEISRQLTDILPFSYRTSGGSLTILSRFSLVEPQSKTLKGGTILVTSFAFNNKNIQLIAAHPLVPIKPSLFQRRNTLLAEMTEYIRTQQGKTLILLGDMNLTPWSPYYKRLVNKTNLHNTRLGFGVEPSWIEPTTYVRLPSWIVAAIKIPIDHIFVSNDIRVANCKTLRAANADHRMLLSDLAI
jgi:endonuclease/exonuclease/phosphatase (EEP) superfamily protein YafD